MNMLALGDNVVDCYLDEKIYYPGGNAVNVAVGCKRAGFDRVEYMGVFGDDKEAEHLKWALSREGIPYGRSRKECRSFSRIASASLAIASKSMPTPKFRPFNAGETILRSSTVALAQSSGGRCGPFS